MIDPQSALIVSRFLHDAALMLVWGCYGYIALAVPKSLATTIKRHLGALSTFAVVVVVLSTLTSLPAQVALIGNGWSDALDVSLISSVLTLTSAGRVWFFEAVATCALLAIFYLARNRDGMVALVAGAMLAGLAFIGHASMHAGTLGAVHRLVYIVHLLAAGAWFGALVPFTLVMKATQLPEQRQSAIVALYRFSRFGHVAVSIALVSGVLNTLLIVGHLPTDWRSPYEMKLLFKIGIVLVMTLLAMINRYVFVPRLKEREAWASHTVETGAVIEIGLGVVAIALVAAFGTEDPAL